MGRDGTGRFTYLLKQKSQRRTNQADQYTETKTVDVAEQRALLLQDAVENGGRFLRRRPPAGSARQCGLGVGALVLKVEIKLRQVPNKACLARLRPTRGHRAGARD